MTKIEWCDETINPIIGCTKVSPGCENCYAELMANRLSRNPMLPDRYGFVVGENGKWNGALKLVESELKKPFRWKKPKKIFVGSMGDIFHESVYYEWLADVLLMARRNHQHTFIFLTKRPENALKFLGNSGRNLTENIWFGVTVENQEQADKRIPALLQIPAKIRFVSVEPMLSAVNLSPWLTESPEEVPFKLETLSWVICGAETGPKARIMHSNWAEDLEAQCKRAKIPFFFKKWSGPGRGDMPRQFPE